MSQELEAGWYPCPSGAARQRYFDGRQWTNTYREDPADADPVPSAVSSPPTRRTSARSTRRRSLGGANQVPSMVTPSTRHVSPADASHVSRETSSPASERASPSNVITPTAHWKTAVIRNYGNFEGRAGGAECGSTLAINAGILLMLFLPVAVAGEAWAILPVVGLFALASPTIAVAVRRLHDSGKSGAYVLLGLIPLVGTFILLGLLAAESELDANTYGRPTK